MILAPESKTTTTTTTPLRPDCVGARRGFTLNEVLIAMGILALGITAVASLFPTGALLQKQAVQETLLQNHIRSGDAILEGVGVSNRVLLEFAEMIRDSTGNSALVDPGPAATARLNDGIVLPEFDVYALAEIDTTIRSSYDARSVSPARSYRDVPVMTLSGFDRGDSYVYDTRVYTNGNYPIDLRSLPSDIPAVDDDDDLSTAPVFIDREVFYVPLVRQGTEASTILPDWTVYSFILQPTSQLRNLFTATSPQPRGGNAAYRQAAYEGIDVSFDNLICANPGDPDYVPKVFRIPVDWNSSDPFVITPGSSGSPINLDGYLKAGELVLGDNGRIYRIAQFDTNSEKILLEAQTVYDPANIRPLAAIWAAPATGVNSDGSIPASAADRRANGANQASPLGDIRLLSNGIVRMEDF